MVFLKKYGAVILVFVIAIVLIFVGSFNDLSIAQALYNRNNTIGRICAIAGAFPAYLGVAYLAGLAFIPALKFNNKTGKFFALAICVCAVILGGYFSAKTMNNADAFNFTGKKALIGYGIALVFEIITFLLGIWNASKSDNPNLFKLAFTAMFVIALAIGTVTLVKVIMYRPRFRFLIGETSPEGNEFLYLFRNWWESGKSIAETFVAQGIAKEEFKSFPSGHSNAAAMLMMVLPIICATRSKWQKYAFIGFIIGLVYSLLIMLARMCSGAHFMSDVSFGLLVALIFMFIGQFVYNKKLIKQ